MAAPDLALKSLEQTYTEFGRFIQLHGASSEADTRAKVIDRILGILGWTEESIRREEPILEGYIDYVLSRSGRPVLVVEAKRDGVAFEVPASLARVRRYKLDGAIKTAKPVYKAIEQAQIYCIERALPDAVVTNGSAWLVFRALRKDIPWRQGYVHVFPSARYILDHFVDFWNLLSYDAVALGSLDRALASDLGAPKPQHRVLANYRPADADAPLARNRLHAPLHAFVESIFRDIAEPHQEEQLRQCYVRDENMEVIDEDLKVVIRDSIPAFVREGGADLVRPGSNDSGLFGRDIGLAAARTEGSVFLLLGGIGSGKTTLLKRFFNFVGRESLRDSTVWFYLDLRSAPADPLDVEDFVAGQILDQLRERGALGLEDREFLKQAYRAEIAALDSSILSAERLSPEEYERRLSRYLEKWRDREFDYARHILTAARSRYGVVICLDNVDQWPADYQAVVFLLAQRLAQEMRAVTIVALREESYYVARIQKVWTAYNNRKFHIASPSFYRLIELRMAYLRQVLDLPEPERKARLRTQSELDNEAIARFFTIIGRSIFRKNRNIVRFIEALAFGNMRDALEMFSMFLYSGAIDVDKMLTIYARKGSYTVPFHEFAKAIILGDRAHYRESSSRILNVFDRGPEGLSSHFTALRLLNLLLTHLQDSSAEGRGFVSLADVIRSFADVFGDEHDVIYQANRLLRARLVQVETRNTDTIDGARFIRATTGGWYYSRYLANAFAYLDLVSEDTAFESPGIVERLWELSTKVERIRGSYFDSEEERVEKLDLRFQRVDSFVRYLARAEGEERASFGLKGKPGAVASPVMTRVFTQYKREQAFIKERFAPDLWEDEPEQFETSAEAEFLQLLNFGQS